jgi:hypothetical protein
MKTNRRELAELIGIAAIVASLIFVGLQIRQEQNVAVSQIYQTTMAAQVEIHIAMVEHAELLAKARNVDELTEAERIAVEELIEMWFARSFFESVSARRIDDGDWSGPVNIFAFLLADNPGLHQLWSEKMLRKENFYTQFNQGAAFFEFNDQVRQKLASLQGQDN